MRFVVISRHLPEVEGSPAGRILLATSEGLLADGHDIEVRSWRPEPPTGDIPPWCTWRPLPPEPAWRTRARALVRPRSDVVRAGWAIPADSIAVADDPVSFAAVAHHRCSVVTIHYATALDRRALGRRSARDVQDQRAEWAAARRATIALAYSSRVADRIGAGTVAVPAAIRIPAEVLPIVDRPVAALVADWAWPPNRLALRWLLEEWPSVRANLPGARLLLAGRGDASVGAIAGVTSLGPVERSADVLAEAAVLAFPSPPTSGPKYKVLEAMASGLPVVTTSAGTEGLGAAPGSVAVAPPGRYGAVLADVLADVGRRADMARRARDSVAAVHAPLPAARARVAACRAAFD